MPHRPILPHLLIAGMFASIAGSVLADDAPLPQPTRQELLDPAWIETTLAGIGVDRLIKLYDADDAAEPDAAIQLVQDALMLSRTFLREHPEELRSQLQARLLSSDEPDLQVFQDLPPDRVRARATRPSLIQAGDALRAVFRASRSSPHIVTSPDGSLLANLGVRQRTMPPFDVLDSVEIRSGLDGTLRQVVNEGEMLTIPAGFSPDLTQFYGVCEDGIFHAWDVHTGDELWRGPTGFGIYYRAVCVTSPDSRLVAVSSFNSQVVVFDSENGDEIAVIPAGKAEEIWNIAFLDNETLAGGCKDQVFRHWDISTGEILEEFPINLLRVTSDGTRGIALNFKLAGNQYTTYGFDVHDTRTGELLLHTDFDKSAEVTSYEISPDNLRLIIGIEKPDSRLIAYSLETGAEVASLPLRNHIPRHAVATTGNRVLTIESDEIVHVWDLSRPIREADQFGNSRAMALTADGGTALTRAPGLMQLWNTETWNPIATFAVPSFVHAVISDDGARIVYTNRDEIHSIDTVTGQTELLLKPEVDQGTRGRVLAISGDGLIAAANLDDEKAALFDASNGELVAAAGSARSIVLSYDGSRALLDNRLFDRVAGVETEFEFASGQNIAMSADASLAIASGPYVGNTVWDTATGEQLKGASYPTEPGTFMHYPSTQPVAMSGNGRFAVSCSPNFDIYLYDVEQRQPLAVVNADQREIALLDISDDGSYLLVQTKGGGWHHYRFENLPP